MADPHCDVLLVGDSLGNVLYGFDTTLPVTLDMMIMHGRAVVAASRRALVVVDMPFASYEASKEQAFASSARVMQETGCGAVKLEGGVHFAETIAFLVARGIPVMGHVGLTPQSIHTIGSFRSQGKAEAAALGSSNQPGPIEADAIAVAEAGAFSMVIEAVVEPLARHISERVAVPTIGIGASQACDGQVLVLEDMLGMTERTARFVRRFADRRPMRQSVPLPTRSGKEHSLPENICMGCPEHDRWVAWELPRHPGMTIRCGAAVNFTLIAFSPS
jgi:3-methyl-2-oxobutanoate hydroxymethyltransferase